MMVKRDNGALIEIRGRGPIRFRPGKFTRALGETAANEYRRALDELIPEAMAMQYPQIAVGEVEKVAPALLDIVRRTLERVEDASH